VETIIACLKLYNDKDHHANGNTNSKAGNVDDGVIPVTDQTSKCGFEIIFKHERDLSCKFYSLFTIRQSQRSQTLYRACNHCFYLPGNLL